MRFSFIWPTRPHYHLSDEAIAELVGQSFNALVGVKVVGQGTVVAAEPVGEHEISLTVEWPEATV